MRIVGPSKKEDQKRLLSAFPSYLHQDVLIVFYILYKYNFHTHPYNHHEVKVNKESLIMLTRVYCDEPKEKDIKDLNDVQTKILNCILLNHKDGFLRQNRLERLVGVEDYFIIPFIFKLIGEYVFEITEVIYYRRLGWLKGFARFIEENKDYGVLIESRMISYWNEYYRRPKYPKLDQYVGYKLMKEIKATHRSDFIKDK